MTATPYLPTSFSVPVVNPAAGSEGAEPLPYISLAEYQFAPTAMSLKQLVPGGTPTKQAWSAWDVIRRASRWADNICFGEDPAGKASLAASLSVQSGRFTVVDGEVRLVCDYKPILTVNGVDMGASPATAQSVGATVAARIEIHRRTLVVPVGGACWSGSPYQLRGRSNRLYVVWSYVNGYPHTKLLTAVEEGATSCKVMATNGRGGLWGVFPASGGFLGTQFEVVDGVKTETVSVKAIVTGTATGDSVTLTTSPFSFDHSLPAEPDFLPMTALPEDIHQALVTLSSMVIKTSRGGLTLQMPTRPGQAPDRKVLSQAGATGNWNNAVRLLHPYGVRSKSAAI